MANFLKTYAVVLVVFVVFLFFGGLSLFDFNTHFYAAIASWAFVLALLVAAFTAQGEKIEQLEKRVSELEEKDGD